MFVLYSIWLEGGVKSCSSSLWPLQGDDESWYYMQRSTVQLSINCYQCTQLIISVIVSDDRNIIFISVCIKKFSRFLCSTCGMTVKVFYLTNFCCRHLKATSFLSQRTQTFMSWSCRLISWEQPQYFIGHVTIQLSSVCCHIPQLLCLLKTSSQAFRIFCVILFYLPWNCFEAPREACLVDELKTRDWRFVCSNVYLCICEPFCHYLSFSFAAQSQDNSYFPPHQSTTLRQVHVWCLDNVKYRITEENKALLQ